MPADTEICHFVSSKKFEGEIQTYVSAEMKNLGILFDSLNMSFEHVGGAAIPGALTKKDIDIQIRVEEGDFNEAVKRMNVYAKPKNVDSWSKDKAVFKGKEKELPTDYQITIKGSPSDVHFKVRDFLMRDPAMLQQYNDIKRSFEGKTYAEYRPAKRAFLDQIEHMLKT